MTKITTIAWKELRSYFASWVAYVLLAGWLFIGGYVFSAVLDFASTPGGEFQISGVYQNLIVILLFVAPLITMRLVAEERSQSTLELLFTSPLTEWQVTLGKFFGAWGFVFVLLALTAHFPFFATRYGSIDTGPVWGAYVALMCLGAAFVAFGLFCSSLTESQVVAGFLTFGGLLVSWLLSVLTRQSPDSDIAAFLAQWSVYTHLSRMIAGAIDTADVIFFASLTLLFLYATTRVLESRKWR